MTERPDPLDALRLPTTSAESPRPEFAAALRGRLTAMITPPPQGATMEVREYVPAELRAVTPYLCVNDGRAAIEWYGEAFGATLRGDIIPMLDDKVGHAELVIGDSLIMLSDEWPDGNVFSPTTRGGASTSFVLNVADVDTAFARAVRLGATQLTPVADQEYGSRSGWLLDPFGHRWSLQTPLSDVGRTGDDIPLLEASRSEHAPAAEPFTAEDLWNEVGYFTIDVADLARARAFFNALFGWQLAAPAEGNEAYVHNPSTKIPMGFTTGAPERTPHLFFRVRDIAAMCERVEALGGTVVSRDHYASGGNAVCRDDQGNEFDLWEPSPGY